MGQEVPVQVVLAAKALLTARTLEGLLPGVGQPVSHQVVPPAKALATLSAHVALGHRWGPLALLSPGALLLLLGPAGSALGVHSLVAGQVGVAPEILATLRAPAGLVLQVGLLVADEVMSSPKALLALEAAVGPLSRVRLLVSGQVGAPHELLPTLGAGVRSQQGIHLGAAQKIRETIFLKERWAQEQASGASWHGIPVLLLLWVPEHGVFGHARPHSGRVCF